jgi:hypothetical protein
MKAIPNLDIGNSTIVVGSTYLSALLAEANTTDVDKSAFSLGIAYADITNCLVRVRQFYKIPEAVKLTVSYMTIDSSLNLQNIEKGNAIAPSVKVTVYRSDNNTHIDTSVCSTSNVKVKTPLKAKSGVNMNRYRTLKDSGIDGLDPNHPAFNDICFTYSDKQSNVDTTINSRRKYYFQGVSVQCSIEGGECNYNEISNNEYIDCNCINADLKNDISSSLVPKPLGEVSNVNFDVIGCLPKSFVICLFI